MIVDALSRRVDVNHITTMSSYGIDLQDQILQAWQQDDMYSELRHKLQQQGRCDQDVDYHLTTNGLVRFRDKIYALYNNEHKKLILMEFHVKPYSGNPIY